MPFTLSHAAAAAPFARYGFVLSALVIGSFSPDFIYFVRLSPVGHFAHTIPGVFLFCLPTGMASLWVYHRLLKEPLAALFPEPLRHSLLDANQPFRFLPIQRMALLAISVTLGAFTHLAWDSFTHETGAALRYMPFLDVGVIDLGFEWMPLTRVLHHASSVAGLVWIWIQARRWVIRIRNESTGCVLEKRDILRSACIVSLLLTGSVVLGTVYALEQGYPLVGFQGVRHVAIQAIVASGAFLSALVTTYGILWRVTQRA